MERANHDMRGAATKYTFRNAFHCCGAAHFATHAQHAPTTMWRSTQVRAHREMRGAATDKRISDC
eukprot:11218680-Lingulodinium_polyedra.AAC.1